MVPLYAQTLIKSLQFFLIGIPFLDQCSDLLSLLFNHISLCCNLLLHLFLLPPIPPWCTTVGLSFLCLAGWTRLANKTWDLFPRTALLRSHEQTGRRMGCWQLPQVLADLPLILGLACGSVMVVRLVTLSRFLCHHLLYGSPVTRC